MTIEVLTGSKATGEFILNDGLSHSIEVILEGNLLVTYIDGKKVDTGVDNRED